MGQWLAGIVEEYHRTQTRIVAAAAAVRGEDAGDGGIEGRVQLCRVLGTHIQAKAAPRGFEECVVDVAIAAISVAKAE